jgi:DNA-binding transcriptional ArsR family regulator
VRWRGTLGASTRVASDTQVAQDGRRGAVRTDEALSKVFAALADPLRRDIVARLASGDATVGELAAPYSVTPQAVSKHLRVLEEAGLVSRRREAQRRPVHLEADVFDLMTLWIERHRRAAEFRHRRLEDVLLTDDAPGSGGAGDRSGDAVPAERAPRVRTERAPRVRPKNERVFQPWDLGSRALRRDAAEPGS